MTDIIGVGLERKGQEIERAVLVGTDKLVGEGLRSMDELADLAKAAGAEPVGVMVQKRDDPHQNTFLGKGKLQELKAEMASLGATVALFDGELSPRQVRNLVDVLEGCKVLDRTELILDIFAQHAHTAEGKLQVELAQLSYLLPRLTGRGKMMDRIGGGAAGVGVRGPGETKLETDRRRLRARISKLRQDLKEVSRRRDVERETRKRAGLSTVSLVGYTNAGKSTLLNALAGSLEVSVRDRLFETLDPTCRKVTMEDHEVLLSDTVGFIHDLPKQLVEAFKATLEEVVDSELLIHVVDASKEFALTEKLSTEKTLRDLNVGERPTLLVLNKWDKADEERRDQAQRDMPAGLPISALTGEGLEELRQEIARAVFGGFVPLELELPYDRMELINLAHAHGRVFDVEYEGEVVRAKVEIEEAYVDRFRQFAVAE
ncbi:MAG: GTPase HflX [Armatimonadia bacterium]